MSIEVGNLVRAVNGCRQAFYGFVLSKEDVADRWNRIHTYYVVTPLLYVKGKFAQRPRPLRTRHVVLATSELVRLTCLLALENLGNELENERGRDRPYFPGIELLRTKITQTRTRFNQIFAQLDNYVDPRGI